MAPATFRTDTAVAESLLVPSPSCPSLFRPQHLTVPSAMSAHACCAPTATATAWSTPPIAYDPPLPSNVQQLIVPSASTAHASAPPSAPIATAVLMPATVESVLVPIGQHRMV